MKHINRILIVAISFFAFVGLAQAVTPGAYAGLGLGYSSLSNFSDATKYGSNGGLGGRVFAGYNFNSSFGLEANYAKYATTSYVADNESDLTSSYSLNTISVVGKLYFPLNNSFDLYVLFGAAQANGNGSIMIDSTRLTSSSTHAVVPVAGLGGSYTINSYLSTTIEYSRAGGDDGSDTHIGIPESNLLTLSLICHLG